MKQNSLFYAVSVYVLLCLIFLFIHVVYINTADTLLYVTVIVNGMNCNIVYVGDNITLAKEALCMYSIEPVWQTEPLRFLFQSYVEEWKNGKYIQRLEDIDE